MGTGGSAGCLQTLAPGRHSCPVLQWGPGSTGAPIALAPRWLLPSGWSRSENQFQVPVLMVFSPRVVFVSVWYELRKIEPLLSILRIKGVILGLELV